MSSQGGYRYTYRCEFWSSHNCDNWVYMNGERCHGCIILGRGTLEEVSGRMETPEHIQQVIEGSIIPPLVHGEFVEYPDGSTGQRCIMYYTSRRCKNFTRNEGLIKPPSLCDSCPEPATTDCQTDINYYRCIYCSASGCSNWVWASGIPCRACEPSRDSIVKEHRARTHPSLPPEFPMPSGEDTLRGTVGERNETLFQTHEAASPIPHQSISDDHPARPNDPALQKYAIEVASLLDDMGKRLNEDSLESEGLSSRAIPPALLPSSESSPTPTTSNYYKQNNEQNAWAGWVTQIVNEINRTKVEECEGRIPPSKPLQEKDNQEGETQ